MSERTQRIHGVLLGGAAGDSLGLPGEVAFRPNGWQHGSPFHFTVSLDLMHELRVKKPDNDGTRVPRISMKEIEEKLRQMSLGVRKKPGMYFGCGGARAITEMVKLATQWLVQPHEQGTGGSLEVVVECQSTSCRITLELTGRTCGKITSDTPEEWFSERQHASAALMVACASSEMLFEVSGEHSSVELAIANDGSVKRTATPGTPNHKIRVTFLPDVTAFGPINETELCRLAGVLEDVAILNPGIAVGFTANQPSTRFEWRYPDGIRGWLLKRDHSRWPLHSGTLSFSETDGATSVEGHLRFLHAGASEVRSWVNGHPVQGGAHLEGLGDVLTSMFPSPDEGCRRVLFVTNPDSNALIWLPHCFIGAIKLSLPDPRYYGPTKDVLMGDDVRAFVRKAALRSLPELWESAQRNRP